MKKENKMGTGAETGSIHSERRKECLEKGSFLGMALICSSVLALSIQRAPETALRVLPYFPAALIGYLGVGILFWWIHTRPAKRREGTRGMGLMYWYGNLFVLVLVLAQFIPESFRGMLLANLLLLTVLWSAEYVYLWRIAKELNGGIVGRPFTLMEDLDEKPENTEAFLEQITKYCVKNKIRLEIVTREKPVLVRMDGILYRAEVQFYYSRYGTPVYTMEFVTETEKEKKR